MIALKSEGFRSYLDLDLHMLIFFHMAFAEIVALAVLGPKYVVAVANKFHRDFVQREKSLWVTDIPRPMDIRFALYEHMGRLDQQRWRPQLPPPKVTLDLL